MDITLALEGMRRRVSMRGWVALWRPVELLLYDPWVLRRDIALYRRLETADVSVTPGA